MAKRRMIAKSIVCSDDFVEMSFPAQALYIQLAAEADDFGFCDGVRKIMRYLGTEPCHLEELEKNRFVIQFKGGVIVIRQWFIANYGGEFSKPGRGPVTTHIDELLTLAIDNTGAYDNETERNWSPNGVPTESQRSPQYSIDQMRVVKYIVSLLSEKSRSEKNRSSSSSSSESDTRARTREEPTAEEEDPLRNYLFKHCEEWANENVYQELKRYRYYERMTEGLLKRAIDFAANADNPPAYLHRILEDYKADNLRTLEDALHRDEQKRGAIF